MFVFCLVLSKRLSTNPWLYTLSHPKFKTVLRGRKIYGSLWKRPKKVGSSLRTRSRGMESGVELFPIKAARELGRWNVIIYIGVWPGFWALLRKKKKRKKERKKALWSLMNREVGPSLTSHPKKKKKKKEIRFLSPSFQEHKWHFSLTHSKLSICPILQFEIIIS